MNKSILVFSLAILLLISIVAATSAPVKEYEVWQDLNDDSKPDTFLGYVTAYDHGTDVVRAYDYYSASSHVSDPKPEAYKSKIWVYNHKDVSSVGMTQNSDKGGKNKWSDVNWNIYFNTKAFVALSDDKSELFNFRPDFFKGRWSFKKNSDGGVITFYDTKDTVITFEPKKWEGIKSWAVYSADGKVIELDKEHTAFITKGDGQHNEVPEFGTLAAIGVLGLAGLFIYKRRN